MVVAVAAVLTQQYGVEYEVCRTRCGQSRLYWRFVGGRASENAGELSLQGVQCQNPSDM